MLLSIDTSLSGCHVGIMEGDLLRGSLYQALIHGHSRVLAPMVDDLLKQTHLYPRDLTSIGVTIGPGSFTGIRVGLSMAKGLALALGIPLIGIHSTTAMAQTLVMERGLSGGKVAVVLDTRRQDFYVHLFHVNNGMIDAIDDIHALSKHDALDYVKDADHIVGDAVVRLMGDVSSVRIQPMATSSPHAMGFLIGHGVTHHQLPRACYVES